MLFRLCSFLPTFIILYRPSKTKQRNKEEARTFLVPDVDRLPRTVPTQATKAHPGKLRET